MFAPNNDYKKLKKSFIDYANSIEWINPYAITLTLKQRVDNLAIDIVTVFFHFFLYQINHPTPSINCSHPQRRVILF